MFSGQLVWGKGVLVVEDLELMPRLAKDTLSPSTAAALAGCPARWALDRLIPSVPDPMSPAEIGHTVHAVFERLFDLTPEARTFERAWQMAEESTPDGAPEWLPSVRPMVEGLWKIEAPERVQVANVEMKVESEVNGVPFYGIVDRLDDGPEGVVVVDYKTGKLHRGGTYDTHGDQLRLYVAALRHLGINPSIARLYYVAHGEVVRVDLSRRKMDKTQTAFAKSWETLGRIAETHTLPCVPSPLCGWCPAVTICPTAATSRWPTAATPECESAGTWLSIGGSTLKKGDTEMNTYADDKPWVEIDGGGRINLGSYASQAVFGTTELALEILVKAGLPTTVQTIREMATSLLGVTNRVASRIGASGGLQGLSNARIRGAMRSVITITPTPDEAGDEQEWGVWFQRLEQRTFVVCSVATSILADENKEES